MFCFKIKNLICWINICLKTIFEWIPNPAEFKAKSLDLQISSDFDVLGANEPSYRRRLKVSSVSGSDRIGIAKTCFLRKNNIVLTKWAIGCIESAVKLQKRSLARQVRDKNAFDFKIHVHKFKLQLGTSCLLWRFWLSFEKSRIEFPNRDKARLSLAISLTRRALTGLLGCSESDN